MQKSTALGALARLPLGAALVALASVPFAAPLAAQSTSEPIVAPTTGTDNVFVDQIGSDNLVDITQELPGQTVEVRQNGNDNVANVGQSDTGACSNATMDRSARQRKSCKQALTTLSFWLRTGPTIWPG